MVCPSQILLLLMLVRGCPLAVDTVNRLFDWVQSSRDRAEFEVAGNIIATAQPIVSLPDGRLVVRFSMTATHAPDKTRIGLVRRGGHGDFVRVQVTFYGPDGQPVGPSSEYEDLYDSADLSGLAVTNGWPTSTTIGVTVPPSAESLSVAWGTRTSTARIPIPRNRKNCDCVDLSR